MSGELVTIGGALAMGTVSAPTAVALSVGGAVLVKTMAEGALTWSNLLENVDESNHRIKQLSNDLVKTYVNSSSLMSISRSMKYGATTRTGTSGTNKIKSTVDLAYEITQAIRNNQQYKN